MISPELVAAKDKEIRELKEKVRHLTEALMSARDDLHRERERFAQVRLRRYPDNDVAW